MARAKQIFRGAVSGQSSINGKVTPNGSIGTTPGGLRFGSSEIKLHHNMIKPLLNLNGLRRAERNSPETRQELRLTQQLKRAGGMDSIVT
jgi:hypothetical protein